MRDFEKKVRDGVFSCLPDVLNKKNAVAVSGGADSVSLLVSLCNIFSPLGITTRAITVNHNIRPKKETCGDVDFVVNLCERLKSCGKLTECFVAEIPDGAVKECAEIRKRGIEEAARFLRYNAFFEFCRKNGVDVLFLAHNKNDNLETLLMRFLQGGGLNGVPRARKLSEKITICRPLLKIERSEIEKYLTDGGFSWRTDSTNCDEKYFRNKIRLKLIPFLNDEFPEWKNAVLNAAEKSYDDCKVFDALLNKIPFKIDAIDAQKSEEKKAENCENFYFSENSGDFYDFPDNSADSSSCENFSKTDIFCGPRNSVKIPLKDFLTLENALKTRAVVKAMNLAGENRRIPYAFVKDLIDSILNAVSQKNREDFFDSHSDSDFPSDFASENKINFIKNFGDVQILCKKDCIFFKKNLKKHTDLFFFDIIEKSGTFSFPFGNFVAGENKKNVSIYINDCFCCENLSFPFIVRSAVCGDAVKTADGGEKKVSDIFSDFHIGDDDKKFIPIVQSLQNFQPIVCVLGNFLGYKNWIVKNI